MSSPSQFWGFWAVLFVPIAGFAQTSATTTQTLSAQISPAAKLSVPASFAPTASGTTFSTFTGNLLVSQRTRTTSSGSASITVEATSEFAPAGGPTVASGALNYTCSGATLGTGCSGTQTVSTTAQTSVLTVGGGACTGGGSPCSTADPNTVSLSFTLTNSPAIHTGTFSAQVTFLISAL